MSYPAEPTDHRDPLDVVIIGAGIVGLYQLLRLRELPLSVRVLEAGDGVGGTWYWNRYPGARLDSESYSYGYFFSKELLDEWDWSEEFAGQPELERYLNHVADKFELRDQIEFGARVVSTVWNDTDGLWELRTEAGAQFRARFVIAACGILSDPQYPPVPGRENFRGQSFHTARWPKDPVDLGGKRVAVIGTGATGVQVIQSIADQVGSLTVFQRTPNWSTPINNHPISPERMAEIKASYEHLYEHMQHTPGGFVHEPRDEDTMAVSEEERLAHFARLYAASGLSLYQANFRDITSNQEANDAVSAFIAERIRERIDDPDVADKLVPKDHGFAMKRPPLENRYFEVYNQPNVSLVSLADEPLVRITERGLQTTARQYEFDVIIYATGFDAGTGAYLKLGLTGRNGVKLSDVWSNGPRTYLGLFVAGFPNFMMAGGPQASGGNNYRATEQQVDWLRGLLGELCDRQLTRVEAQESAQDAWVDHVSQSISTSLRVNHRSWYFGSNVEGKPRAFVMYGGTLPQYRAITRGIARDWAGLVLDGVDMPKVAEAQRLVELLQCDPELASSLGRSVSTI